MVSVVRDYSAGQNYKPSLQGHSDDILVSPAQADLFTRHQTSNGPGSWDHDPFSKAFERDTLGKSDHAQNRRDLFTLSQRGSDANANYERIDKLQLAAYDSDKLKEILRVGNAAVKINDGVATVAAGTGAAAIFAAHVAGAGWAGGLGFLTGGIHAGLHFIAASGTAGTASSIANRGLRWVAMDDAKDILSSNKHSYAQTAQEATSERQGTFGAAIRNQVGENGLNHINDVIRNTDGFISRYYDKMSDLHRTTPDCAYAGAGIPTLSHSLYFSRAEEILFAKRAVSTNNSEHNTTDTAHQPSSSSCAQTGESQSSKSAVGQRYKLTSARAVSPNFRKAFPPPRETATSGYSYSKKPNDAHPIWERWMDLDPKDSIPGDSDGLRFERIPSESTSAVGQRYKLTRARAVSPNFRKAFPPPRESGYSKKPNDAHPIWERWMDLDPKDSYPGDSDGLRFERIPSESTS